jgi:hypothetical protein
VLNNVALNMYSFTQWNYIFLDAPSHLKREYFCSIVGILACSSRNNCIIVVLVVVRIIARSSPCVSVLLRFVPAFGRSGCVFSSPVGLLGDSYTNIYMYTVLTEVSK